MVFIFAIHQLLTLLRAILCVQLVQQFEADLVAKQQVLNLAVEEHR